MNKVLLVSTALIAGVVGASAADMSAPAYKAPAAPAAAPSWAGFYAGANAGYGFGNWNGSMSFADGACCGYSTAGGYGLGPVGLDTDQHSIGARGALAGGQIGYNWQSGRAVFGVEADADWSGVQGNSVLTPFPQNFPGNGEPFWGFGVKNDWIATFRGRMGYDQNGTLVYGTGGLAVGGFNVSHSVIDTGGGVACAAPCASGSMDQTKLGWTVGAGVEQAIDRNWSVKVEYLYTSFAGVGGTVSWDQTKWGTPTDGFGGNFNVSTVKAGANYRF